jgi:RES domain-containing protein
VTTFRVVRRPYAGLTREGARRFGGRFTPPGIPAVYTSQSIALALLEVLVHIEKVEMPADYVIMAIRFSGREVSRSPVANLIGANHFATARFAASFYRWPVLRVPSVIVPREYNFILLPEADRFAATTEWVERLDFDRRLLSSATS